MKICGGERLKPSIHGEMNGLFHGKSWEIHLEMDDLWVAHGSPISGSLQRIEWPGGSFCLRGNWPSTGPYHWIELGHTTTTTALLSG